MKKIGRRMLTLATAMLLLASMELSVLADTWYLENGDVVVNADASGQTVSQAGSTPVADSAPVITQEKPSVATSNTITVNTANGADANVTIQDVNIEASGEAAMTVNRSEGSEVTVELNGENTLTGGSMHAGLETHGNGELIVQDVDGEGILEAMGGYAGAGIGGGNGCDATNITITGGNILVTGGSSGAGIGGGSNGSGSGIVVNGGEVTATGGSGGAGIGGGHGGAGTDISIQNGEVTAEGGLSGAGIGGGYGSAGDDIVITGGEVNAQGGMYAAGIGGGNRGNGTDITIKNGTVYAEGGKEGAGIGGGTLGAGENIAISGGDVTAQGGSVAAGIGGGYKGAGTNVVISGGTVEALGGTYAAGIGGGYNAAGSGLVVKEYAIVTALGQNDAADSGNGEAATGPRQQDNVDLSWLYKTGSYTNRYGTVYGTKSPPEPPAHVCSSGSAVICNGNLCCGCGRVLKRLFTVDHPWEENLEDSVLTVTVDESAAILSYWLFGIQALVEQDVHTLVFVTAEAETVLDLNQWLSENNPAGEYQIQHRGTESTIVQSE